MHTTSFEDVPTQVEFPELEEQILQYWNDGDLYARSVEERSADNPFIFYDGPPFASGLPHYGHLLASIIKDVVPRYWTMRGYRVERRFGWDCHGLPVENEAEQQLGLKTRKDIVEYGVPRFNEYCRSLVLRYTAEWESLIRRVGRWVDWANQYHTMDVEFMESVWWVFKSLWDRELVYEGYKSLAYCPLCATPLSNFEVNQGYRETQDPSITVRFRVRDADNLSVLAWTTTPWTVPSNSGLAVNPKLEYVEVGHDGRRYIVARERAEALFGDVVNVLREYRGEDLVGLRYSRVLDVVPEPEDLQNGWTVVGEDFVKAGDGTGIVHMAPAFGADDYAAGQEHGLPMLNPIDASGTFNDSIRLVGGMFV